MTLSCVAFSTEEVNSLTMDTSCLTSSEREHDERRSTEMMEKKSRFIRKGIKTRANVRKNAKKSLQRKKKRVSLHPQINGGPLAQLNRVFDYGSKGCRFESCMGHFQSRLTQGGCVGRFFFLCVVVNVFYDLT